MILKSLNLKEDIIGEVVRILSNKELVINLNVNILKRI